MYLLEHYQISGNIYIFLFILYWVRWIKNVKKYIIVSLTLLMSIIYIGIAKAVIVQDCDTDVWEVDTAFWVKCCTKGDKTCSNGKCCFAWVEHIDKGHGAVDHDCWTAVYSGVDGYCREDESGCKFEAVTWKEGIMTPKPTAECAGLPGGNIMARSQIRV
ncbi:hypothetical protein DRN52_08315 [Thermococci archaeon]|nr:MAG: hypothetical protein DRN52_08315 [Thermococci archaeon]